MANEGVLEPTYTGFIRSTLDALIIFEACRRQICPKIARRLQDKEKHLICSGSVFVFTEAEAGIKRWTDGLVWSPSRILGNFLVYRELVKRGQPGASFTEVDSETSSDAVTAARRLPRLSTMAEIEAINLQRAQERALVGSLTGSTKFKPDGLIKKTISLGGMHMITYYSLDDVYQGRLREPSSLPELSSFEISPDLLTSKSFRQPPSLEYGMDGQPRYRGEGDEGETEPISPTTQQLALPIAGQSPSISSGSGSAPSSAGSYLSHVGEPMFGYGGPSTVSTSASSASLSRPLSPVDVLAASARPGIVRHSSGGALASSQRTQPRYELPGSRPTTSQRFEPYQVNGRVEPYGQAGRRSVDEGLLRDMRGADYAQNPVASKSSDSVPRYEPDWRPPEGGVTSAPYGMPHAYPASHPSPGPPHLFINPSYPSAPMSTPAYHYDPYGRPTGNAPYIPSPLISPYHSSPYHPYAMPPPPPSSHHSTEHVQHPPTTCGASFSYSLDDRASFAAPSLPSSRRPSTGTSSSGPATTGYYDGGKTLSPRRRPQALPSTAEHDYDEHASPRSPPIVAAGLPSPSLHAMGAEMLQQSTAPEDRPSRPPYYYAPGQ